MKDTRHTRKRRTCYDRLRERFLRARRIYRADPAASAATQLFAVFTVIFGHMPLSLPAPAYVPYSPPRPSPAALERTAMARRFGVPIRYLDLVILKGHVPYCVLFDHFRQGGALRRDAMSEFRKLAPEASLDWLNYVQKCGRWSDLVRCYAPNEDDQTDVSVLNSTLRWLENVKKDGELKPGSEPETPDPDHNPDKQKP